MVDATDLKSVDLNSRVGSSPTTPIIQKSEVGSQKSKVNPPLPSQEWSQEGKYGI